MFTTWPLAFQQPAKIRIGLILRRNARTGSDGLSKRPQTWAMLAEGISLELLASGTFPCRSSRANVTRPFRRQSARYVTMALTSNTIPGTAPHD